MTPLVLDTNILVYLLRGGGEGRWIGEEYRLQKRPDTPVISSVSAGEILALAAKWNWSERLVRQTQELLAELAIVDVSHPHVTGAYAALSVQWERSGRRMEQNDLWIAATAGALQARLLTTDAGFKKLHPAHLTVDWIDPELLKEVGRKGRK